MTDQQKPRLGDIESRLHDLHQNASKCIEQSAAQHPVELGRVLQMDADIGAWEGALGARPERPILASARRELGFTTYAACSGLYLQAFSNLRLFLELGFAAVGFSIDDLRRRQWLANDFSFSWSAAIDNDTGLFSKQFLRAYRPDAQDEAARYREMAAKSYRHCSEFVHGKMAITSTLPDTLAYSDKALTEWSATARDAARAVLFIIYCRYAGDLMPSDHGQLAQTLAHSFGHLKSVRMLVGLPVDQGGTSGSA